MALPCLTDLHLAAGVKLRSPTFLAMSGDVLVTVPSDISKEGHEVLFMLRDSKLVQADLCTDFASYDLYSGVYTFSNVMLGTQPMHLFVPGEGNYRMVPEDIDGCDPLLSSLPWRGPVLSGIGVVATADSRQGTATIKGRTWSGDAEGWIPFTVYARVKDAMYGPFPMPFIPARGTLVSFDGTMDGTTDDGGVEAVLYRIQYLQYAHPTLLTELGVVRSAWEDNNASRAVAQALQDKNTAIRLLTNDDQASSQMLVGPNQDVNAGEDICASLPQSTTVIWLPEMTARLNPSNLQMGPSLQGGNFVGRMAEDIGRLQSDVQTLGRASARSARADAQMEAHIKQAIKSLQDRMMQHLKDAEARLVAEVVAVKARVEDEAARAKSRMEADMETATQDLVRAVTVGRREMHLELQEVALAVERSGMTLHRNIATVHSDQGRWNGSVQPNWPVRMMGVANETGPVLPPPPRYDASITSPSMRLAEAGTGTHGTGEVEDDATSDGSQEAESSMGFGGVDAQAGDEEETPHGA
ncbi:hypothetical protein OC834_004044 [Tilletia horrida]|nr:hypothetical protein OC834_004044 [Tilletia horrida]